ncbi:MAG: hypothetical protein ACI9UA_002453 [Pseudoalteromonas tetraodonis]|jgi:hypothetical protein
MTTRFLQPRTLGRLGNLLLMSALACGFSPAQETNQQKFRVACFVDHHNESDPDLIRMSLERWATASSPDPSVGVISWIESDNKRWLDAIESGSYDLYGLLSHQYFALKNPSILRPCLAISSNHGITSTFLLITRAEDKITKPSQLRGKKILIDTAGHGELPLIWFATRLGAEIPFAEIPKFASITLVQQPHRALIPVYFGKVDACVITRSAYSNASALNPDIVQKLKTTINSKALLTSVFAFHRDYPLVPAEKFATRALEIQDQRASKDLFGQIDRVGLQTFNASALFTVSELYKEYENLINPQVESKGGQE